MKMLISQTRSGKPAAWEGGGATTNKGTAMIIAAPDGSPKRPIFFATRGHRALQGHALFVLDIGDTLVTVTRYRNDITVKAYKIVAFELEPHQEGEVNRSFRNQFNSLVYGGFWAEGAGPRAVVEEVDTTALAAAIQAAKKKAADYHCRQAYYYAS